MSLTPNEAGPTRPSLTPDRLDAVLAATCRACGLDPDGARLIKFTNSAVFDLPRAGVVAKVAGSPLVADRIPRVLLVARWLEHHGFPAVRLLDIDQPVDVLGHPVTIWHRVPAVGPDATGTDLAQLIRAFHGLPAPDLAAWAPTRSIRRRLREADGLDDDTLAWLARQCDDVEADLARLDPVLPPGPIHGDSFLGNVIPGPDGPVLCDFDSTATGPREWDLTPVAVGSLRFSYPADPHPTFVATYGYDVTTWKGFPTLRRLRELQLVTSVVPVLRANPRVRPQFEHRLASLRTGDPSHWEPYAHAF